MKSRFFILAAFCALVFGLPTSVFAQRPGGQTELSTVQRLDVMSSKLDHMRRSLSSALSSMPEDKSKTANAEDPTVRLKGLEKEVSSLMSEVNDIRSKNDKAEKFDATSLDRLESAVADLNTRVENGLQQTASARGWQVRSRTPRKRRRKKESCSDCLAVAKTNTPSLPARRLPAATACCLKKPRRKSGRTTTTPDACFSQPSSTPIPIRRFSR